MLKGRGHTKMVRVDQRVFWWTKRKLEEHTGERRRDLRKYTVVFEQRKWRRLFLQGS